MEEGMWRRGWGGGDGEEGMGRGMRKREWGIGVHGEEVGWGEGGWGREGDGMEGMRRRSGWGGGDGKEVGMGMSGHIHNIWLLRLWLYNL